LPAEIFSYPGEEPSDEVRKELERYGAVLRTVEEAQRDTKRTWVLFVSLPFIV
jgi:alpha 1,2-mannosyltransferase